ncbi:hypothetical protein BGZ82_002429 [Podila clonocystis]|nr:hypothetical protein BGZ82_002429 [Podila clonocystis]
MASASLNSTAPNEYDVVVVGSGAAGMTAALTATKRGLSVVVIEKAPTFGGSTARSGGGMWLPNNSVILNSGVSDTLEQATASLSAVVGPDVPNDRQKAFLNNGPQMLDFVMANIPLRFRFTRGYSDYYPNLPGSTPNGRCIKPKQFNSNLLGAELKFLNRPFMLSPRTMVTYGDEYRWLNLTAVNIKGPGLAAGLRVSLMHAKVPAWLKCPLVDLVQEGNMVTGVVVEKDGIRSAVRARKAVIISSGGFKHNAEMKAQYQQKPIGSQWSVGAKENIGDGHSWTISRPKFWYESGVAKKASSLEDFAKQIEVPAHVLESTISRFNGQARDGINGDFSCGDVVYDRHYVDPKVSPNPCRAPLEFTPFYAFKIVPGDLGTKGGIITDACARALRTDGLVIRGRGPLATPARRLWAAAMQGLDQHSALL